MQGLARSMRRASHRPAPAGEADYRQGLADGNDGRWQDALRSFERAVARSPSDSVFWLNLAHAQMRCGHYDDGAQSAQRGAKLAPQSEPALAVAAECLNAAHRQTETVALLGDRDLANVRDYHVHFELGQALHHLGRFQEAADRYLAGLSRKPDHMAGHVQLGNVFNRLQLHEESRECYKTAIAVGGDAVQLLSGMAFEDLHACRWDHLAEDLPELMRLIDEGAGYSQPFQLLAQPSTRAQQHGAARRYADAIFTGLDPLPSCPPRAGTGRIRLGYLSSDLHEHATAYLLTQILEHHDRSRFEVSAYSYGADDASPARRRIENAVDHFVDVREMSDRAAAERIRADGVDILLDLKGYTLGARNGILALRPSPIQVNYLGFPGTLGAPFYDYIVGDPTVTPLAHAADYSEKIAQMPMCYQPNDRSRAIGSRPQRSECGLPEYGFVFCSFNSPYKITAEVFDAWCRLLRQVDGSVLWLYETNSQARRNLTREALARGIATERIIWGEQLHQTRHLARLQLADLVLDTRPVCAHTTASDALWAGVPVITCPGDTFVSRVAASLLQAIDLPELIATDAAHYESLALSLARDPQRLADLKARLALNRESCALFDSVGYTRDLEALFARMHERCAAGHEPEHLAAPGAANL
ncbi:MAG: tetratricopeptide repeat protein [Burkholderiaceae bacterium]|nr:tetratricopeptide repeat protein [Burkholderiaceae bacterium]